MVIPIFLTCGPNEVLVVSGVGYSEPAMVTGGRVVAFPCIQRWNRLSLNVMTIQVDSPAVYTSQGVAVNVTGVAQVKISTQHPKVLQLACEHFLEKSQRELERLVTATLEGHQRGIMGTMTVEDIYMNRKLFNTRVFTLASNDLANLGLHVISYTIKDLSDDLGYLEALGKGRTAEVQRDARIGEAEAKKLALINKCQTSEELLAVKYANDTKIAKAERDFQLQKAVYDQEVRTKAAQLSSPQVPEESHGLDRAFPQGPCSLYFVLLSYVNVYSAVFHDVLYSVGCTVATWAGASGSPTQPLLVAQEGWVVPTPRPGQVDSVLTGKE